MSRTNETRFIEWREIFKCKCRLDAIYFVYYNWSLIKNVSCIKLGTHKETKIW